MNHRTWLLIAVLALALLPGALPAAEPPASPAGSPAPAASAPPAVETAVFAVPMLGKGSLLKDLLKALQNKPGVVSARPERGKEKLMVSFEPGKTTPLALTKILKEVSKAIRFEGVTAGDPKAAAGQHDCGRCPFASSCGSKKQ